MVLSTRQQITHPNWTFCIGFCDICLCMQFDHKCNVAEYKVRDAGGAHTWEEVGCCAQPEWLVRIVVKHTEQLSSLSVTFQGMSKSWFLSLSHLLEMFRHMRSISCMTPSVVCLFLQGQHLFGLSWTSRSNQMEKSSLSNISCLLHHFYQLFCLRNFSLQGHLMNCIIL